MQRLIVAALCGLLVPAVAIAECDPAERAQLEKLDSDWGAAGGRGDRAFLQNLYADDFVDLTPGMPQDKRATIADTLAEAERNRGNPPPAPVYDFYLIQCTPTTATITHRVTSRAGADAAPRYFRSVHTLEKRAGRWQVVANAGHVLDDAGVVRYLDLEWNLAEVNGDTAWFERHLADDFVGVGSRDGRLTDKRETIAEMAGYRIASAETTGLEVDVHGDTARASGVYHVKGTDPSGQAFDRRIRYIDVFIKRDGRWQVWSSQGTALPD